MTNNDKMLAQFGTDWVKVRDYIKSLKIGIYGKTSDRDYITLSPVK